MASNRLLLNLDKMQFLWLGSKEQLAKLEVQGTRCDAGPQTFFRTVCCQTVAVVFFPTSTSAQNAKILDQVETLLLSAPLRRESTRYLLTKSNTEVTADVYLMFICQTHYATATEPRFGWMAVQQQNSNLTGRRFGSN